MSTHARANPDKPEYPTEQLVERADYDDWAEREAEGR